VLVWRFLLVAPLLVACSLTTEGEPAGAASGPGATGVGAATGAGAAGQGSGTGATSSGGSGAGAASGGASGSASASGGAGGTGGEACSGEGDPCTECLFVECQQLWCGCTADPACTGLLTCLDPCTPGDNACEQPCLTMYETAISSAVMVGDCGAESCAVACPGSGDQDACGECLFTSCATAMNGCFGNPACVALIECYGGCLPFDAGCFATCDATYSGGSSDFQAIQACSDTQCMACP
jgi:hypothetical protein